MKKALYGIVCMALILAVAMFTLSGQVLADGKDDTAKRGVNPCAGTFLEAILEELVRLGYDPNDYLVVICSLPEPAPPDSPLVTAAGDPAPPRVPEDVTAVLSGSEVTIEWGAPLGTDVDYYVVVRRDKGAGEPYGAAGNVEWSNILVRTHTDQSVEVGHTYGYTVYGMNETGYGYPAPEVTVMTVPAQPTGLAASAPSTTVTLSWDDSGNSAITRHDVLRRNVQTDASGVFSTIGTAGGHSYVDADLTAGTNYVYKVTAVNATGSSIRSEYVNVFMTAPNPPDKPRLTVTEQGKIEVRWSHVDRATSYKLWRRNPATDAPGAFTAVQETTSRSHVDTNVSAGDTFIYRVSGVNAYGESGRSRYTFATSPLPPPVVQTPAPVPTPTATPTPAPVVVATVPARPTGLTNTRTGATVSLRWANPDDSSVTHYQVLRRNVMTDAPGLFHQIGTANGHSYGDTVPDASVNYVYRVVAVNATGASPRSSYSNAIVN